MVIFHSYVSLPEGNHRYSPPFTAGTPAVASSTFRRRESTSKRSALAMSRTSRAGKTQVGCRIYGISMESLSLGHT